MVIDFKLIGSRIKEYRHKANLTQEKLAEYTDLSVQYIGYLENGRKGASLNTIVNIANVLNITLDPLLLGNLDCEITAHICEFSELIINHNYDERDLILESAILKEKSFEKQDAVPLSDLERIAKSGLKNQNKYIKLIILPDKKSVQQLYNASLVDEIKNTPSAIAVCFTQNESNCSVIIENMLITAVALGYSSFFLDSIFFKWQNAPNILEIPAKYRLHGILPIDICDNNSFAYEHIYYEKFGRL